jgi:hypothetical protein
MFLPYMDKNRTRVHIGRVEALAPDNFARESESLLNRKGTVVFRKEATRTLSKYRGFGVYSMNKTVAEENVHNLGQ